MTRMPKTGVELDLHYLAAVVRGQDNPFSKGVMARLQGVPFYPEEEYPKAWESGWHFADRVVDGLEIIQFIQEGEP